MPLRTLNATMKLPTTLIILINTAKLSRTLARVSSLAASNVCDRTKMHTVAKAQDAGALTAVQTDVAPGRARVLNETQTTRLHEQ